jgi:hypothetical protein
LVCICAAKFHQANVSLDSPVPGGFAQADNLDLKRWQRPSGVSRLNNLCCARSTMLRVLAGLNADPAYNSIVSEANFGHHSSQESVIFADGLNRVALRL